MEHEQTDGLMIINYREPKSHTLLLRLEAEHCLKRAKALEDRGQDIGERVDIPMPDPDLGFNWPGTVSSVPPPFGAQSTPSGWPEHLPSEEEHERAKTLWRQRGPLPPEESPVKDM